MRPPPNKGPVISRSGRITRLVTIVKLFVPRHCPDRPHPVGGLQRRHRVRRPLQHGAGVVGDDQLARALRAVTIGSAAGPQVAEHLLTTSKTQARPTS